MNAYEITEVWAKSTFKYWEETANILQENLDRLYDACKEYEKEYYLCNYRQTACPYATLNGYCKLTACLFNLSLTCRKGAMPMYPNGTPTIMQHRPIKGHK